jgi:hypothetical protein
VKTRPCGVGLLPRLISSSTISQHAGSGGPSWWLGRRTAASAACEFVRSKSFLNHTDSRSLDCGFAADNFVVHGAPWAPLSQIQSAPPGYFRHRLVPPMGSTKNRPLTAGCKDADPLGKGLTLNFENGTVHSIRSVSQRALAASWARLCNEGLPSFDQFDPEPGIHDPKQLVAWKVEIKDGQLVFRALYRGRLVDEAFNDGWAGKTLREVTPPSLQPAIIGASDHCVSTGCAIYAVLRTYDGAGFPIELERLLLPFGTNGRVKIIVASLQLTSLERTVERGKVAKDFEAHTEAVVSMRISAASINKSVSKSVVTSDGVA